jgi:hypothetical protein
MACSRSTFRRRSWRCFGERLGRPPPPRGRGARSPLSLLPEHLLDEGGADAEAGGELCDGVLALFVGADDPLA